jgi:hypothetical protein
MHDLSTTDPIDLSQIKKKQTGCPIAPGRRSSGVGRRYRCLGTGHAGPGRCSGRYSAEAIWPLAPDMPKTFWPELLSEKRGTYTIITLQYTLHPNQKKERQTILRPRQVFCCDIRFRRFSAVTVCIRYFRRALFPMPSTPAVTWFRFISRPRCPHSVTPAYFESLSYSLSTTSC